MRWLDGITDSMDVSLSELRVDAEYLWTALLGLKALPSRCRTVLAG